MRSAALPVSTDSDEPAVDVRQGLARNAIAFPDGIPGFEACRQFVLLTSEAIAPLQRLEALEGPPASFIGVDPRLVMPSYPCRVSESDLRSLGADPSTTLLWFVIITVEADGTAVANLRAPIVINPDRMLGRQVLPDDVLYPIRHVLTPEA